MSNIFLLFAKITMGDAKMLKGYMIKEEGVCNVYPNENKTTEEYKEVLEKSFEPFEGSNVELKIQDAEGKSIVMKGMLSMKEGIKVEGGILKTKMNDLEEGEIEIIIEKV